MSSSVQDSSTLFTVCLQRVEIFTVLHLLPLITHTYSTCLLSDSKPSLKVHKPFTDAKELDESVLVCFS